MANGERQRLPHLTVRLTANAEPYTYPRPVRGGTFRLPERGRREHAERLLGALARIREESEGLGDRRRAVGVADEGGVVLEFESDPEFELRLGSLERTREGIELLAVREREGAMLATVLVPEGKLQNLERLITAYRDVDLEGSGQPKNKKLVESVADLRRAALESFWTDEGSLFPQPGTLSWWEVWLRAGQEIAEAEADFRRIADAAGIEVKKTWLKFADRIVLLAVATPEQMTGSVELLDCIAELRLAKDGPEFFMRLDTREQADWIGDLLGRTERLEGDLAAVCVLDTGVNNGHPLLRASLADEDLHTCKPAWGVADHHRHGTEMAGLSLYGDLTDLLAGNEPVFLEHSLESVKILPAPGHPPNERELYGALTREGMARAETARPERRRVFCMAVSTPDDRDRGQPSSWSAAIDAACCGIDDNNPRLVVLAGGNVARENWGDYPGRNDVDQIHDPGQSWNALTVGAFTEKARWDSGEFPGWEPLARAGGLSPGSTTSVTWASRWPSKPDLVLEGGNGIRNPETGDTDTDDPLLLLTTHWRPAERLLTTMGDTSAAAAQAGRMAAILSSRYPDYWPETVRGLLVHSAEWTQEMLASVAGETPAARARLLLRRYGYGVPDLERASWSASNLLTLIAQDELTPFQQRGSAIVTREMNLHSLPWPVDQLQALGEEEVELRVTLSYFVEPNPARRGWIHKHRYQSHGLRFAMKAPTEDLRTFRARISRDAQDEDHGGETPADPGWTLGPRERSRGSIHSDRWHGSAADLAERGFLAAYPVGGWWKERALLRRWQRSVRYALLVSILTPAIDVDIYTAVENQIALRIPV